jgi:hypothetical protein
MLLTKIQKFYKVEKCGKSRQILTCRQAQGKPSYGSFARHTGMHYTMRCEVLQSRHKARMYWKWVVIGFVWDGLNRAFNVDDTGIVGLLSECL